MKVQWQVKTETLFVEDATFLLDEMREYERNSRSTLVRDNIIKFAKLLLDDFEYLFGTKFAPVEHWETIGATDRLEKQMAQAHFALKQLAEGSFCNKLPFIDPKDFRTNYSFYESALPKWSALHSIEFLAGITPPRVRRPQSKGRRRLVKLNAVELCAGIGGQAIGIQDAGYNLLGVYERNEAAAQTIAVNRPSWLPTRCDIRVDYEKLRGDIAQKLCSADGQPDKQLDLLSGALPWRAWDGHGKGLKDDKDLFGVVRNLIEEFRPRSFFFETAEEFEEPRYLKDVDFLQAEFAGLGYHTEIFRPEFSDFGIVQMRRKIYLVGIQKQFAGKLQLPASKQRDTRAKKTDSDSRKHRRPTLGNALASVAFPFTSVTRITVARSENQLKYEKQTLYWLETYGKQTKIPDLSRGLNTFRKSKATRPLAPEIRADGTKKRGRKPKQRPESAKNSPYLPPVLWDTWQGYGFDIETRLPRVPGLGAENRTLLPITPEILKALQGYPKSWRLVGELDEQINSLCETTPPILAKVISQAIHTALIDGMIDLGTPQAVAIDADPPETHSIEITAPSGELIKRWICHVPPLLPDLTKENNPGLKLGSVWNYGIRAMRGELPKYSRYDDVGPEYDDEDDHHDDGRGDCDFSEDDLDEQDVKVTEPTLPGRDAASLVRRLV
ncbi:site-specific DNA methylase [Rhizobium leguminosarum bv. trifolii WSM2297]|uniref:Site-specific DNA methylase n=1 Tax=Rhizobium leguminosarum bv. trifolii WSM2297 TaxID=754762 RepID=J0W508_RHILT|nr:DNA cytosine methyltransferase [Rhizobium leguminosarum]EJC80811.1 site-specific DNA methylase [Rhizobium leguminosarum bv. trifolii WSM2297]